MKTNQVLKTEVFPFAVHEIKLCKLYLLVVMPFSAWRPASGCSYGKVLQLKWLNVTEVEIYLSLKIYSGRLSTE